MTNAAVGGGWRTWVERLSQDGRHALRMLRRAPGFAAVAILTLALGIGANTAIFSVVNGLLLRTLPVADAGTLGTLMSRAPDHGGRGDATEWTYAVWHQLRQHAGALDAVVADVAATSEGQVVTLARGGDTERAHGLFVSGSYFSTLGMSASLGRTLTPADDSPGGGPDGPAVVISHALWERRFGGAANAIGAPLVIDDMTFTVVGVTPPRFFGIDAGRGFDVILPLATEPLMHGAATYDARGFHWLTIVFRMRPGQPFDAVAAALRGIQPQVREGAMPPGTPPEHQRAFLAQPFDVAPAAAGTSRLAREYRRPLLAIFAGVALILPLACANLANLLLARATARQHEMSVRRALGAQPWRLAQQLLIESLLLAGLGAAAGLPVAAWGGRALLMQLSTSRERLVLDLSPDWRVVLFTAAVAAATAVLFGMAPALRAARAAPIEALKDQGRASSGPRAGVSSALVVAQVALSLVLVIVAGLFVGTFQRLTAQPLGFDSERVLVASVSSGRTEIDPANRIPLYARLVDVAGAVPGVSRASASATTPIGGLAMMRLVEVPGAPALPEWERAVQTNFVTPGFFATYGTPLRAGRDIDARDTASAPPVVVVNEAFARRFFPGRSAIGHQIGAPKRPDVPPVVQTIVGVVGDAVLQSLRRPAQPAVYQPLAQWNFGPPPTGVQVSIRSAGGGPAQLARSVGAALTDVNPDLATTFRVLDDQVRDSLTRERVVANLSGAFGALALLLAAVGLYGVTAYAVIRRRAEIGIRVALGATRGDVIRLIVRRSLTLTVAGLALGLIAAATVTRYVEAMLFGVTPLDVATFAGVSLLLAAVAALAALIPARRAAIVDPLVTLRAE